VCVLSGSVPRITPHTPTTTTNNHPTTTAPSFNHELLANVIRTKAASARGAALGRAFGPAFGPGPIVVHIAALA
jgi:hypothetical protein